MNGCIFIDEKKQKNMWWLSTIWIILLETSEKSHLLDSDSNIIIDNFTHVSKDYTFREIKDYYIRDHLKKNEKKTKLTKDYCLCIYQ